VVRYNLYTLTDASPADVHRLLYLERELRKYELVCKRVQAEKTPST
jgi:hypothetical protein